MEAVHCEYHAIRAGRESWHRKFYVYDLNDNIYNVGPPKRSRCDAPYTWILRAAVHVAQSSLSLIPQNANFFLTSTDAVYSVARTENLLAKLYEGKVLKEFNVCSPRSDCRRFFLHSSYWRHEVDMESETILPITDSPLV